VENIAAAGNTFNPFSWGYTGTSCKLMHAQRSCKDLYTPDVTIGSYSDLTICRIALFAGMRKMESCKFMYYFRGGMVWLNLRILVISIH
jgi:hypothetical protein